MLVNKPKSLRNSQVFFSADCGYCLDLFQALAVGHQGNAKFRRRKLGRSALR